MPGMKRKSVSQLRQDYKKTKPSLTKAVTKAIYKNADIKEVTTSASTQSSTTSGTVVNLNSIAEGDDYNNRTGRKIRTVAIDVMYKYAVSSATAASAQVALVYDAQPNGSTPTYNTIFDLALNAGMAFKNTFTNGDRFKVLWMSQLPESDSSDATNGWIHRRRRYVSGKKIEKISEVRYGGTTAVTPTTGAWYLCYGDTLNAAATSTITYVCKYQYIDM